MVSSKYGLTHGLVHSSVLCVLMDWSHTFLQMCRASLLVLIGDSCMVQVSNNDDLRHQIEHSSVVYGRACRRTRDKFEVGSLSATSVVLCPSSGPSRTIYLLIPSLLDCGPKSRGPV